MGSLRMESLRNEPSHALGPWRGSEGKAPGREEGRGRCGRKMRA